MSSPVASGHDTIARNLGPVLPVVEERTWARRAHQAERVCFVGDVHGDTGFLLSAVRWAVRERDCRMLVQLGDFGFWPGPAGVAFLDAVERELAATDSALLCIDGNHDWHDWLAALRPGSDGLNRIRPHLWHAPRGSVLPLPGADRCLAAGGAPSIDKNARIEGLSWWAGETLSHTDVERCFGAIDLGPIDLVISHDAPLEVPLGELLPWPPGYAHRRILSAIGWRARPRSWFSGHYHRRVSTVIELGGRPCAAEVLSCNGEDDRARLIVEAAQLARSTD